MVATDLNDSGNKLQEQNAKIVNYLNGLRHQFEDIKEVIRNQEEEKITVEKHLERLQYKLTLINKSMEQRKKTKDKYEKAIGELERKYNSLLENSKKLLESAEEEFAQLDQIMDKKVSTEKGYSILKPAMSTDMTDIQIPEKIAKQEVKMDESMNKDKTEATYKHLRGSGKSQQEQQQIDVFKSGYESQHRPS